MRYKDQLKTSAWLKKRAEIMERDNFVCSICLCDNYERQLHVHHIGYIKGKMAWEYMDYMLVTLCCDCHEKEHDEDNLNNKNIIINWIKKLLKK